MSFILGNLLKNPLFTGEWHTINPPTTNPPITNAPTTDNPSGNLDGIPPIGNIDADFFSRNYDPSYYQYIVNSALQMQAQKYNQQEAEKNRQWQEMMSNSAFQRAKTDMQKAGLNPYLIYSSGNGSSTPSGSVASSSQSSIGQNSSYVNGTFGLFGRALQSITGMANTAMTNSTTTLNTILRLLFK